MTQFCIDFVIAASHPALLGHFPDNPIVPGVLLLDTVIGLLQQWQGGLSCRRLPRVKFLAPVYPGESIVLRLSDLGGQQFRFECRNAKGVVANGTIDMSEIAMDKLVEL